MIPFNKLNLLYALAFSCLVSFTANAETKILYWFDSTSNFADAKEVSLADNHSTLNIDASELSPGLHRLTVMTVSGDQRSTALCRLFLKPEVEKKYEDLRLKVNVDGVKMWEKNISGVGGPIDLDTKNLPVGLHRLECVVTAETGETVITAQFLFFRPEVEKQYDDLRLKVNVDGVKAWEKIISGAGELIDFDTKNLPVGLHQLECVVTAKTGEAVTTAQSIFFKPEKDINRQDWTMTFLADGMKIWEEDMPRGEETIILDASALRSGPTNLVCLITSDDTGESHIVGQKNFLKPNETPHSISGYLSQAGSEYIGLSVKTLEYALSFENSSDAYASSVNRVSVQTSLVPEIYDLATFCMRSIRIGGKELAFDGNKSFRERLDLRPDRNAIAEIECEYDENTGNLTWNIQSLDPSTNNPTDDKEFAILPANTDGWGMAEITYDIGLMKNLADGTIVDNSATFKFDNVEVATPSYRNVLDYSLPESKIISMQETAEGYDFEIQGSDLGSGIWKYGLYVWNDEEGIWNCVMDDITESKFTYITVKSGETPTFATVAVDRAGNKENLNLLSETQIIDAGNGTSIKEYYMPNGAKAPQGYKGIIIENGKKTVKVSSNR